MAKAGIRTDRSQEEALRLQGVEMVLSGMTQVDAAEELGVHPHSVGRWMAAYRVQGKEGLLQAGREGRPPLLDDTQREQLKKILGKGPKPYGYEIGLWTLPRVAKVIETEFGVKYSEPHVWKILQNLGWSCQRPAKRAVERDEHKIAEWKRTTWPALKKTPKGKGKP
jgi:transposase